MIWDPWNLVIMMKPLAPVAPYGFHESWWFYQAPQHPWSLLVKQEDWWKARSLATRERVVPTMHPWQI